MRPGQGCSAIRLYVGATSPVIQAGLRCAAGWVFPPVICAEPQDIDLIETPRREEIPTAPVYAK
jgi:hypothetical protein